MESASASAGFFTSESTFGRTASFEYDLAGNRDRVNWPDTNFVSYSFDAMNRMTEVRENNVTPQNGVLATYGYDARSHRDWLTRANGADSDYRYDAASRLDKLAHEFTGSTQDVSLGFGYTLASQLKTRTSTNRLFDWTSVLPDRSYVPNGLNQYASVSGTTYSHDANGNLTSDGSRPFNYDAENRLTSVSGGASLTIAYDPNGRLYETVGTEGSTQFIYEGDRLVAEYSGGALLRRYVHGPGTDDPLVWYEGSGFGDKRWLHADERGSIIATSDGGGAASVYTYGPYGEPAVWTGSRFRYTGQIALPEVHLYYYKARVFDPELGRFLQTDPVGYEDDVNLYAYTYNDPLNGTDPTGEDCQDPSTGPCQEVIVTSEKPENEEASTIALPVPLPAPGALSLARATPAAVAFNILFGMLTHGCGDSGTVGDCAKDKQMKAEGSGDRNSDSGRNPADDQKLSKGEIDKLKAGGEDPEDLKGGKATGQRDLFKDKNGNIYVKPKDGSGPGDPTGLNIKNF